MPKPFYADYVNHMVRAYVTLGRDGYPTAFKSPVDAANYEAVSRVIGALEPNERDTVIEILGGSGPMKTSIEAAAETRRLRADQLWTLVARVSGHIARDRQLI